MLEKKLKRKNHLVNAQKQTLGCNEVEDRKKAESIEKMLKNHELEVERLKFSLEERDAQQAELI